MAAAAAASELLPCDGEHLDAGLRKLGVRGLVSLVRDDHARLDGDDVVAVVPLVALRLELVASGRDEFQVLDSQRVSPPGRNMIGRIWLTTGS
jgi:hypothetical protein